WWCTTAPRSRRCRPPGSSWWRTSRSDWPGRTGNLRSMDGVTVHERLAGHPGVAQIMLHRVEALNAIAPAMAYRLAQACAELAADRQGHPHVPCAGGGRAFFRRRAAQERE